MTERLRSRWMHYPWPLRTAPGRNVGSASTAGRLTQARRFDTSRASRVGVQPKKIGGFQNADGTFADLVIHVAAHEGLDLAGA